MSAIHTSSESLISGSLCDDVLAPDYSSIILEPLWLQPRLPPKPSLHRARLRGGELMCPCFHMNVPRNIIIMISLTGRISLQQQSIRRNLVRPQNARVRSIIASRTSLASLNQPNREIETTQRRFFFVPFCFRTLLLSAIWTFLYRLHDSRNYFQKAIKVLHVDLAVGGQL